MPFHRRLRTNIIINSDVRNGQTLTGLVGMVSQEGGAQAVVPLDLRISLRCLYGILENDVGI